MTAKAHALGMTSTNYVNGSGLPDEAQITTARDQALLGLVIRNRFPHYYRYFSTLSFNWHGKEMHNHNGLLGNVQGVDGIKTGYTEASGYNLVASVQRGDRHIVSVVLGGTSNGARDTLMRKLIEEQIPHAAAQRTTPPLTEMVGGVMANPIVAINGTPQPSHRDAGHAGGGCRTGRADRADARLDPRRRGELRWRTDDGVRRECRPGAQGRPGFPLVPESRQVPRADETDADPARAAPDPGRGAGFGGRACGSSAQPGDPHAAGGHAAITTRVTLDSDASERDVIEVHHVALCTPQVVRSSNSHWQRSR